MIFRQLFDPETLTYTYLLGDDATGEALLIDPVLEQIDRDCSLLEQLGLRLRYTLETHLHADHMAAGGRLGERLGSRVVAGSNAGVTPADIVLDASPIGPILLAIVTGLVVRNTVGLPAVSRWDSSCRRRACCASGLPCSGSD